MKLTPEEVSNILTILEMTGVSRFNVWVAWDGRVIFRSNGLSGAEVNLARECLVDYLEAANKRAGGS